MRPRTDSDRLTAAISFRSAADDLRAEGWVDAYTQGKAEMMIKLLPLRFPRVPRAIATRIRRADSATLDRWAERALTAKTIGEVVAD